VEQNRVGSARGFHVLGLTPALCRAHSALHPAYFLRDGHWNERGYATVAYKVERFLNRQKWLDSSRSWIDKLHP
jgi:hypothetical protein